MAVNSKQPNHKAQSAGHQILRLEVQVYWLWDKEVTEDSQTGHETGTHRCKLVFECHIA